MINVYLVLIQQISYIKVNVIQIAFQLQIQMFVTAPKVVKVVKMHPHVTFAPLESF